MTRYNVHYVLADGTRGSLTIGADSAALARFATANQLADDGEEFFTLTHLLVGAMAIGTRVELNGRTGTVRESWEHSAGVQWDDAMHAVPWYRADALTVMTSLADEESFAKWFAQSDWNDPIAARADWNKQGNPATTTKRLKVGDIVNGQTVVWVARDGSGYGT